MSVDGEVLYPEKEGPKGKTLTFHLPNGVAVEVTTAKPKSIKSVTEIQFTHKTIYVSEAAKDVEKAFNEANRD
jgi:hypothetical protein